MNCKIELDNLIQTIIAKLNSMPLDLFLERANFKADLSKEEVIVKLKATKDHYDHFFIMDESGNKITNNQVLTDVIKEKELFALIKLMKEDLKNLDVEPVLKITKTKE